MINGTLVSLLSVEDIQLFQFNLTKRSKIKALKMKKDFDFKWDYQLHAQRDDTKWVHLFYINTEKQMHVVCFFSCWKTLKKLGCKFLNKNT